MGSSGIKSSERDDKNGCMREEEMGKKGEQEVEKKWILCGKYFIQSAINLTKIFTSFFSRHQHI